MASSLASLISDSAAGSEDFEALWREGSSEAGVHREIICWLQWSPLYASQTLKGPPQLGLLEMSWPTQRMTQQREHITPHQLFGWPCCCSLGAPSGSDGLQSFPGPGNRKLGFAIWVYLGLDSSAGLAVVRLGLLLDPMDRRAFRGLGIGSGVSLFGFI